MTLVEHTGRCAPHAGGDGDPHDLTWHVQACDGALYTITCRRGNPFGPINVWSHGGLIPVRWRHQLRSDSSLPTSCSICLDPTTAEVYLPALSWTTPAGAFQSMTDGSAGSRRCRLRVHKRDWWWHWRPYATVELDPAGNIPDQIDRWRAASTGWSPDSPPARPTPAPSPR